MSDSAAPDPRSRLRQQRTSLADFGLLAFRSQDLDEVLTEASRLVAEALDVDFAKVLEHRPATDDMLVRAGVGWEPGVVGHATLGAGESSPGGYALLSDAPVVSPDVAEEERFEIPPVLEQHGVRSMVNVVIAGDGEPFGVLEVDARTSRDFDEDDIEFLRNYANLIAAAVERLRIHHDLSRALDETRALTQELRHRVKNLLSLVRSLATQTTAEDRTAEQFRSAFLGRLGALSRVQNLLFEDHDRAVPSLGLTARALEPYLQDRDTSVMIDGADVLVLARQALTLTLVLHELGTNAAKYGALASGGTVHVEWSLNNTSGDDEVQLVWAERGVPDAVPPTRRGFGTRMIERAVTDELGGRITLEPGPDGWCWTIAFQLSRSAV